MRLAIHMGSTFSLLLVWASGAWVAAQQPNLANNRLLAFPKEQQAAALAKVVGEGCTGKTPFYMGIGKSGIYNGSAFWSLRCTNGKEYEVMINADKNGSTRVLDCRTLKAVSGQSCFEKFK